VAARKDMDELTGKRKKRPSSSVWDQTLVVGTVIVVLVGLLGVMAALYYKQSRTRRLQQEQWPAFLTHSDALCEKLLPAARAYFKTVPGDPPFPPVPRALWEPLKAVPAKDVVEARLVQLVGAEERPLPEGFFRYGPGELSLAFMKGWKRKCGPDNRTVVARAKAIVEGVEARVVVFKQPVLDEDGRQYGLVVLLRHEPFPPPGR